MLNSHTTARVKQLFLLKEPEAQRLNHLSRKLQCWDLYSDLFKATLH